MPGWPLPPGAPSIYPSTPAGQAAPSLEDAQASFNGILIGAGTGIGVLKFHGLGGLPAVNSHDQPFPRDAGEMVGLDVTGGRDPAVDLIITADIFNQMANLAGAWFAGGVLTQPFWFKLPGCPVMCSMCRPRTRPTDWDALTLAGGMWTPSITFHANDPRLYKEAQILSTDAATLPATPALTVTNAGNCETRPVLVLTGPLAAPVIQFGESDPPILIQFASGTSIADGDQVVIDLSTPHTVTYWTGGIGGTPSWDAYNWLDQATTSWPTLLPGGNTLSFSAAQDSIAAGALECWFASAYML